MNIVQVEFNSNNYQQTRTKKKKYNYFCEFDVETGDTLVVESPVDGLVTVTVVGVSDGNEPHLAKKYIVDKVDATSHIKRNEKAIAKANAKALLEEMLKEQASIDKYKSLSGNEEAAQLIALLEEG